MTLRGTAKTARTRGFQGWVAQGVAVVGVCAALLGAGAQSAHAQAVAQATRKPYAFRIGDYIPSESEAQNAGSTHNLAFEFDYTIQRVPERGSVGILSLGYIERNDLRIIPFTLTQVYRDPNVNFAGHPVYWGGGIGIYAVRLSLPDTSGDVKGLFGLHALVGLDISDNVFIDAKYHYPFHYDRKFFGGLQVGAGVRF